MKRKLNYGICLILFQLLTHQVVGQTDSVQFTKGLKAVQFEIGPYFNLSSFRGTLISFKKYSSNHSAWQFGFSFNGDHQNRNRKTKSYPVDTVTYIQKEQRSQANVSLYTVKQNYFKQTGVLNVYYSIGMVLGFDHEYYKPGFDRNVGSIGPVGAFGVEWLFHRNFSLFTEYLVEGRISYGKEIEYAQYASNSTQYRTKTTITGYSIYSRNVQFGLSAFF